MNYLKTVCIALSAICLTPSLALAHEPGAHVHGVGNLQIAVDANTLTLNLESPLDNLLGFEHLPHTDKQKAAVRAMADRLNQPATLFLPTPAAQCKPVSTKLDSLVLTPAKKADGDGHADLDGEFVFHCEHPQALRDMEVKLFEAFPHMKQLDVQVVSAHSQVAAKLSPKQQRIVW